MCEESMELFRRSRPERTEASISRLTLRLLNTRAEDFLCFLCPSQGVHTETSAKAPKSQNGVRISVPPSHE